MPEENVLKDVKIAVTGASGFLGGHFLPLAREAGVSLTCLSRDVSRPLPDFARVVHGDAQDSDAMLKLSRGQDILLHMAGMLFGHGWRDYFRANLGIARNIVQACEKLPAEQRPKKIIFVSSLAASGPSAVAPGKKETDPCQPVSAYGWSKLCCEQALASAPVDNLVILRPPIIYGSGDRGMLPLFKSIAKGIGVSPGSFRKFPASLIHGQDAARAILLACGLKTGGVFHLDGSGPSDMDNFCRLAAKAMNRKCLVLHPPLPIMKISAICSSLGSRFLTGMAGVAGRPKSAPPRWNYDKYLEAREPGWLSDGHKFVEETGFAPVYDLESGLRETVAGYRARGWL